MGTQRFEASMTIGGFSPEECVGMPFAVIEERNNMHISIPLKEQAQRVIGTFVGVADKVGDPSRSFNRSLLIEEAVMNVVIHGNEGKPELLSYARLAVEIHRSGTVQQIAYLMSLDDHGPTFDFASIPDPTADENIDRPTGRGIMIIREVGGATMQQIPRGQEGKTIVYSWSEEFNTAPPSDTSADSSSSPQS